MTETDSRVVWLVPGRAFRSGLAARRPLHGAGRASGRDAVGRRIGGAGDVAIGRGGAIDPLQPGLELVEPGERRPQAGELSLEPLDPLLLPGDGLGSLPDGPGLLLDHLVLLPRRLDQQGNEVLVADLLEPPRAGRDRLGQHRLHLLRQHADLGAGQLVSPPLEDALADGTVLIRGGPGQAARLILIFPTVTSKAAAVPGLPSLVRSQLPVASVVMIRAGQCLSFSVPFLPLRDFKV